MVHVVTVAAAGAAWLLVAGIRSMVTLPKLCTTALPQVPNLAKRLKADPRLAGLQVVPCISLHEALREALGPIVDSAPPSSRRKGASTPDNGSSNEDSEEQTVYE